MKANVLHFALLVNTIAVLILMQGINVDRTVALVRKPNLGHSIDYLYITRLSTDSWLAWEEAMLSFEKQKDCGIEQMEAASGANSLLYSQRLHYLDEWEKRSEWQKIGAWVKPDLEAKAFLDKNRERLEKIQFSYPGDCAPLMPDRYY